MNRYVALLRGINVGGHHKVPMTALKIMLESMGYQNIVTILNSGNVIFDAADNDLESHKQDIATRLETTFGFAVPVLLRPKTEIQQLIACQPFKHHILTKNLRFYVTFSEDNKEPEVEYPWISEDGSFKILSKQGKSIVSILDVSKSQTPKAMEVVEKFYGKNITTRNWNTILRLQKKL